MLQIAICEDEVLLMQDLVQKVRQCLQLKNKPFAFYKFTRAEQLLTDGRYFDIVFLDIKLDGINGMAAAKKLRTQKRCGGLIFVTALREYVYEAFAVEAQDYLLKPVDAQKLNAAMDRILCRMAKEEDAFFLLGEASSLRKVRLNDLLYCESEGHATHLFLRDGEEIYRGGMERLEHALTSDFCKCHRSYLVNLKHVRRVSDGYAVLTSGEKVPNYCLF